nr:hypothetical protein GCM10020093_109140 [Planobispora longispora]
MQVHRAGATARKRKADDLPACQTPVSMDPLPSRAEEIGTPRLTLEPLRVEHAEEMAAALADPALHTFIGGSPATAAQLRDRYTRMLAGPPSGSAEAWLNWAIRLEGSLVGYVQATVARGGRRSPGWSAHPGRARASRPRRRAPWSAGSRSGRDPDRGHDPPRPRRLRRRGPASRARADRRTGGRRGPLALLTSVDISSQMSNKYQYARFFEREVAV